MARILVTGGCGFIGGYLVEALRERGDSVAVLDDLSSGDATRANGADLRVGSILDPAAVADAMDGVDAVIHLAAIASVERCTREWQASSRVNLAGTVEVLLAAAAHAVPVVFASSAAIYGAQEALPIREDAAPKPLAAYGADKLGGELHARAMAEAMGLRAAGLRFFNVYGRGQDPRSPYSGVISIFWERLRAGLPLIVYGDGGATRDFIHVTDVVAALAGAADALRTTSAERGSFAALNVCTGISTSVVALARTLAEVGGREAEIIHAPARAGEIRDSLGDPAALHSWLALPPRVGLADGLRTLG